MKIDNATLERIAGLARLDLGDASMREGILSDMQRVLDFVERLNEVDTRGVEPLIFLSDATDVLREDVAFRELTKEEVLSNAPIKDSDYFKVPRMMDQA